MSMNKALLLKGSSQELNGIGKRYYQNYAEMFQNDKTLMNGGVPKIVAGGLKEEFSKISGFGAAVSPEAKAAVDTAKQQLLSGELMIFKGELKDNKGNIVIPAGEAYSPGDPRLNSINWFVEGIQGDSVTGWFHYQGVIDREMNSAVYL